MSNSVLIGRRVQVGLSDPWEFVTENGSWRTGSITNQTEKSGSSGPLFSIDLDEPVEAKGKRAESIWASFRHADDTELQLLSGESVFCNYSTVRNGGALSVEDDAITFLGGLQLLAR